MGHRHEDRQPGGVFLAEHLVQDWHDRRFEVEGPK